MIGANLCLRFEYCWFLQCVSSFETIWFHFSCFNCCFNGIPILGSWCSAVRCILDFGRSEGMRAEWEYWPKRETVHFRRTKCRDFVSGLHIRSTDDDPVRCSYCYCCCSIHDTIRTLNSFASTWYLVRMKRYRLLLSVFYLEKKIRQPHGRGWYYWPRWDMCDLETMIITQNERIGILTLFEWYIRVIKTREMTRWNTHLNGFPRPNSTICMFWKA